MFGHVNQRAVIFGCRNGVHTLTIAMNASTPNRHALAWARDRACRSPSVFITSQVAPSNPYPNSRPTPVASGNGLTQSKLPPAKCRPETAKPCT